MLLKNKQLWLALTSSLVITNINSNNYHETNSSQHSFNFITKTVTNAYYNELNKGNILVNQDKEGAYHIYDISGIINNDNLQQYAKYLIVNDDCKLTFKKDEIKKENLEEFELVIATAIANKEVLKPTNDFNIFQKQNLSKISNTAYVGKTEPTKKWILAQFGGANKHIKLEGEQSVISNISDYSDLSESLAIQKIANSYPRNSKNICDDFIKQFIAKSSLQGIENSYDVAIKILVNIINNKNLNLFIDSSPVKNICKVFSMRYLLDSHDNVISISYNQYDNSHLATKVGLNEDHNFPNDDATLKNYQSMPEKLLKWSDYADNWNNFIFLYPSIFADNDANITYNYLEQDKVVATVDLKFDSYKIRSEKDKLPVWRVAYQPIKGFKAQGFGLNIFIWHDENYVWQQIISYSVSRGYEKAPAFTIKINEWTFFNIISK